MKCLNSSVFQNPMITFQFNFFKKISHTVCVLQGNFEFGQFISCRFFEWQIESLKNSARPLLRQIAD